MFFIKKNNLFGLDIGSSSIKMAELKKTSKGYQLLNFGITNLPPEAIVEGAIIDSMAVVNAIRTLLEIHKPRTRNVATAVSGHSVIIKKISLPAMSKDELGQSIQWEAEQYIPFNINEVNLDFQPLSGPQKQTPEGTQMDVLLVAAKRDLIEDYSSVLSTAGLRPVLIDVASFAMENMYETNYEVEEDEVVAAFNIGASVTNINIFKNGSSLFTRDIHFGGNQFNEEIQKILQVSYQEAEQLKLGGATKEGKATKEVKAIVERITEALLTETQRSLEFFSATSGDEKIHKIMLSGGCSSQPGLAEKMEDRLGLPVEVVNPFRGIAYDEAMFKSDYLREVAPLAAVSIGLAIRRVGDQ
jgi:type IV pilus assembly protein PilM